MRILAHIFFAIYQFIYVVTLFATTITVTFAVSKPVEALAGSFLAGALLGLALGVVLALLVAYVMLIPVKRLVAKYPELDGQFLSGRGGGARRRISNDDGTVLFVHDVDHGDFDSGFSSSSSLFEDRFNPSTGLPMVGGSMIDVGGHTYGSSD